MAPGLQFAVPVHESTGASAVDEHVEKAVRRVRAAARRHSGHLLN